MNTAEDKAEHRARMQEMIRAERKIRQSASRTPAGVVYLSTFALVLIALMLVAGLVGSMLLPAVVPDFKVDSTAFTAIITLVPLAIAQLTIYRSDRNQHRNDDSTRPSAALDNAEDSPSNPAGATANSSCTCACNTSATQPQPVGEGE